MAMAIATAISIYADLALDFYLTILAQGVIPSPKVGDCRLGQKHAPPLTAQFCFPSQMKHP